MYELWKERLLVYAGVRISNNRSSSGANSKGKGKEVETHDPPVEEFSVIEWVLASSSQQKRLVNSFLKRDFSVDSSLGSRNKKRDNPQEDLNTSATSSKVSINNSEKEDPLLPFYAKAREEAQYVRSASL